MSGKRKPSARQKRPAKKDGDLREKAMAGIKRGGAPHGRPPSQDAAEVLAWLDDDPLRTVADAAAKFGHDKSKIRVWQHRRRTAQASAVASRAPHVVAHGGRERGDDTTAASGNGTSHAENVVHLSSARPQAPLPTPPNPEAQLRSALRTSILRRLRWLGTEESLTSEHQRPVASALASLVGCKDAILELGIADPTPVAADLDLSTPDGEAAMVERLAGMPPHLIAAALERMKTG